MGGTFSPASGVPIEGHGYLEPMAGWRCAGIAALMLLSAVGVADTVWLENGDRLTGKVLTLAAGKLSFQIEGVGTVAIPVGKIVRVDTTETVALVLKDRSLSVRLTSDADRIGFVEGGAFVSLSLGDVVAINPPKPTTRWEGSTSAGLTVVNAASNSVVYNVAAEVAYKNAIERKVLTGSYLYGRQNGSDGSPYRTHQDTWRLSGQYERSLTGRYYGFGGFRLEGDQVNGLKQRTILGGGMGYYWVRRPGHEFSAETGFNYVSEAYGGGSRGNSRITGQLSTRFLRNLGSGIELRHSADYYPSLSHMDDYLLSSQLALRSKMANGMFVDFRVVMDYDSTPAANATRLAYRYVVGLGTRF